jgi:hypothetical protein
MIPYPLAGLGLSVFSSALEDILIKEVYNAEIYNQNMNFIRISSANQRLLYMSNFVDRIKDHEFTIT